MSWTTPDIKQLRKLVEALMRTFEDFGYATVLSPGVLKVVTGNESSPRTIFFSIEEKPPIPPVPTRKTVTCPAVKTGVAKCDLLACQSTCSINGKPTQSENLHIEAVRRALAMNDAGYQWDIQPNFVATLLAEYDALRRGKQ